MVRDPLEFLAGVYGNVVLRDRSGNPSVFVEIGKCSSKELDSSLPNHVHPAFIIDGVARDSILLGKYKSAQTVSNGTLYSIPNVRPIRSLTADVMLARMRAAGPGITGMTAADWGLIKLLAQKNGWVPEGNTQYGQSHKAGTVWRVGRSYAAGAVLLYEGWRYTCLQAHTSSAALKPDISPEYWQKGEQVGGICNDTSVNTDFQTGYRTLNGTGPAAWYLGGDVGSLSDVVGSSLEIRYGLRMVDCEIQIMENNDAADPAQDMGTDSAAWRAILPHAADDGYDLVAPGTEGTLHWNWNAAKGKLLLDVKCDDLTLGTKSAAFTALEYSDMAYVPSIVKELGLYPTGAGDATEGNVYVNFAAGEFLARGGSAGNSGTSGGLGSVRFDLAPDGATTGTGSRPRAMR